MALLAGLLFAHPSFALSPGDKAPNIFGRNMDKSLFRLSSVKSEVVLINFFWVHCKPCVRELPELAELEHQYPDIHFLAIHVEDESFSTIQDFLKRLPNHPANVVKASAQVKKSFQVTGLPHTVIIRNGKIESEFIGYSEASFNALKSKLKSF